MTKQPKSIDGFVLSRHDDSTGAKATPPKLDNIRDARRSSLGNASTKIAVSNGNSAKNTRKIEFSDDVEDSLENLGGAQLDDRLSPDAELPELSRRDKKRLAKADKKGKKSGKKKWTKRRIAKWVAIILLIGVVVAAGFLAIKALLAGGKVFKGNILDAFTTKTKLKEDSNGWTNILIASTSGYSMDSSAWDGATLTDSIMVLSVNQTTNQAYTMSLPRDLWVKHETCPSLGTTSGKLNEVYNCGSNGGENEAAGMAALKTKTGEILGLTIQYYVHPNWTALQKVVDAVGGVDVEIKSTDSRGVCDSATGVKYPNGTAHLDGNAALALARARGDNLGVYKCGGSSSYGLAGGNFSRENYQRAILAAVQQKAVSVGTILNPASLNSLIDAIGGNLITDFQSSDIQTLIDLAKNVKNITSLPFVSRPDDQPDLFTTGMVGAASVVMPMNYQTSGTYFDYSDIQAYIAQNLSNNPVVKEGATIDVLNGSGETGAAATEAKTLKTDGYTIGATTNAPSNITDKVEVFDLSDSKYPETSKALAKKYGVSVQSGATGSLAGYSSTDDAAFVIIVGPGLVVAQSD